MAPNLVTWLQERTALNSLDRDVLEAIAPLLQERTVQADRPLVQADTPPDGLYILRSGRLESNTPQAASLLPGSAINLQELLLNQDVQHSIVARNDCELWWVAAAQFRELANQFPQITQIFSQKLAEEVKELSSRLNYEQERQVTLRPYLVSKAKRGVIGKSRYAVRLRSQIKQAAENRQSILIFGEPGLEKDNLAAADSLWLSRSTRSDY